MSVRKKPQAPAEAAAANLPPADAPPPPTDEQDLALANASDEQVDAMLHGRLARWQARQRLAEKGLFHFPEEAPVTPAGKPTLSYVPAPQLSQGNPRPSKPKLDVVTLNKVAEEKYTWLWPGRIPSRDLSVIMGPPGLGKSTLLTYLAASVTRGASWPDAPPGTPASEPGSVLIIQGEEHLGSVHRPRAVRMGADISRMHFVKGVMQGEVPLPFNLAVHVAAFEEYVTRIGDVKLVLVDPIAHFLGGVDGNGDIGVRAVLGQYIRIAQEKNIAVLMVMHLNKDEEKSLVNRGSGTGAFVQMPRMVWYLSPDPHKPARRLLSLVKGNAEDHTQTAVSFGLVDKQIVWGAKPVPMSAQEVADALEENRRLAKMAYAQMRSGPQEVEAPKARSFILEFLAAGPKLLSEARKAAEAKGIKPGTFSKALDQLVYGEDGPGPVEKAKHKGRQLVLSLRAKTAPTGTAIVRVSDLRKWSLPGIVTVPPR